MKRNLLVRLKFFLVIIGPFFLSHSIVGQSLVFSDYRMAPLSINPALTGSFEGTYRISGIYRNQWGNVDNSSPFSNPHISIEGNLIGGLLSKNDWVALAVSMQNSPFGGNGESNQKVSLTALNLGYNIGTDKDYSNVFSVGLNYGSMNRSTSSKGITPRALLNTIPGQDPVPVSLGLPDTTASGTNLSIGLSYKSELENESILRIGASVSNLLNSDLSFIGNQGDFEQVQGDTLSKKDPLGATTILHSEYSMLLNDKMRLNPAVLIGLGSSAFQYNIQSTIDYLINAEKQTSATIGLGYRSSDAIIAIGGIQIKDLKVHLAYDLTTSSLSNAGGNSFELSVGYIGRIFKQPQVKPVIFCPRL